MILIEGYVYQILIGKQEVIIHNQSHIKYKCPRCYLKIDPKNIALGTDVGFCSNCNLIFKADKKRNFITWLKDKLSTWHLVDQNH